MLTNETFRPICQRSQVVKACAETIGFYKVGLRLSPGAYLNEIIGDKRDAAVFQYLLEQLNALSIAYVHTGNFDDKQKFKELNNLTMTEFIRTFYNGNVIACGSYTFEQAALAIEKGQFDLIAMGRAFITNPYLIKRLNENQTLVDFESTMLTTLY